MRFKSVHYCIADWLLYFLASRWLHTHTLHPIPKYTKALCYFYDMATVYEPAGDQTVYGFVWKIKVKEKKTWTWDSVLPWSWFWPGAEQALVTELQESSIAPQTENNMRLKVWGQQVNVCFRHSSPLSLFFLSPPVHLMLSHYALFQLAKPSPWYEAKMSP